MTLVWVTGEGIDQTLVCVRDKRDGAYFEIATEPYLALDVFHHPFAHAAARGLEFRRRWPEPEVVLDTPSLSQLGPGA